jgi:hypothetical protein
MDISLILKISIEYFHKLTLKGEELLTSDPKCLLQHDDTLDQT